MSRIAILSNNLSHLNRAGLTGPIRAAAGAEDILHCEIGAMAELPGLLDEIIAAKPEVLVINGGDGTLDAAITYFLDQRAGDPIPPIAVLPAGKTNMTAADFGAHQSADKILRRLIERARSGRLADFIVRRHVLRLDRGAGERPLYGFFFGAAAIIRGIKFCRARIYPLRMPNFLSHFLAILFLAGMALLPWRGARAEAGAKAIKLSLDDGAPRSGDYFIVMATTLDRLLMNIAPFAPGGDGKLKVTTIDHRVGVLFRALWSIIRGTAGTTPVAGMLCENGGKLHLDLDGPFTLDGELFTAGPGNPVTVSLGPSLEFVDFA